MNVTQKTYPHVYFYLELFTTLGSVDKAYIVYICKKENSCGSGIITYTSL